MAISRYLIDVATRYQVYLERLKAGTVARFDPTLRALDKSIRAALVATGEGQLNALTQKQLEALLKSLRTQMGKDTAVYTKYLTKQLKELSKYAAEFEAESLRRGLNVPAATIGEASATTAWLAATTNPIQATGSLLESFIEGWEESLVRKVEGAIRNGYAQGQTTDQIIRALRGTKARNYADGLLTGAGRRETAAMVRTALQHASSAARQATMEANEDILDGYRWISTLDSRTTTTCRSLDNRVFKLGKGPMPPIHVNCRSVVVPEIKDVDLLSVTTRASRGAEGGKQVEASKSYYEWLKTQPTAFQDDVLGPVRGKLFREGGLSAEQFAALNLDKNFQPLSLEEMRSKAPRAFERAGI